MFEQQVVLPSLFWPSDGFSFVATCCFGIKWQKVLLQMDLKADFWHGKVKTYLVSFKLFKFYAKPKKSADLAHF